MLVLGARNLIKTKVGRAFIAIRDADIAAETMGVNLTYYKTLAFAVSAFYTGIAGGLFAFVLRFIEPEIFGMMMSIIFLAMVVVGGLGSLFGSIAGACLLSWLDLQLRNILSIPYFGEWLESLSKSYFSITGVSNIQFIVYGLIMVLIMILSLSVSMVSGYGRRYTGGPGRFDIYLTTNNTNSTNVIVPEHTLRNVGHA